MRHLLSNFKVSRLNLFHFETIVGKTHGFPSLSRTDRTIGIGLVKSPGVNFINVFRAFFCTNVVLAAFFQVMCTQKKLLIRRSYKKTCSYNVDEIDGRPYMFLPRWQLLLHRKRNRSFHSCGRLRLRRQGVNHQHFRSSFWSNILLPQKYIANLRLEKSCTNHFFMKNEGFKC